MPTPKGVSGNPRGRPPKNRALTTILEAAGAHKVSDGEKAISAKQLMARLLWEGATTGRVSFGAPTAEVQPVTLALAADEWLGLVKFIYQHIDGPPKQTLEHIGKDGGPLQHEVKQVFDHDKVIASIAGRSGGDSLPPGADEGGGNGPALG